MKKEGTDFLNISPESSNNEIKIQATELEKILDSTNTIIWTIDKNYHLTYSNSLYQKECKILFNRLITLGENSLPDELSEEVRSEWKSYYDRVLNGEKFSIELKRRYSKEDKWSAYHFGPLTDANEKVTGVSIVAHDITDRIITAQALENSTKRFEELVDMLPDAIFEMDTEHKLTYVNKYGLELFGYTQNDIGSINGIEMLAPEYREIAKQNFLKRLTGDNPGTIEYKGLRKDGSEFPILFHANSVFENGKLKGVRGLIIDISNQKKEQERQKQLAMMLDFAPSSIIVHDFEGNLLYANQKTFDLHGYSREEFMLLTLKKIDSSVSAASIPSRMKLIRENGEASFQVVHIKKDGSVLPLEVYALTTEWNGKQAILSVGTDITMRKRDEKILRESEERFKNIFNNSVVGISVTDIDGKLNINKSFSQIVGYSEEELNNSKWEEITHPEDIDKNKEILRSIFDGESKTARWEKRYIHKNGKIVWVDISTTLHRDNKGTPQYFITSIVDITERKKAEEKLLSSQQILEGIFNTLPVRIFWKDKNLNYMGCNSAFANDAGLSTPKDIIGKDDFQLIWNDLAEIYRADDILVINSGIPKLNIEESLPTHNGKNKIVLTNKIPLLDTKNKVNGVLGTYWDITERKQAEKKLIESEERFRSLYENSTIGLYRISPDGKILMANPTLAKMLLFDSPEELYKRNLVTEGFKQFYERKEFKERIEKEGVVIGLESVWSRKDNTPVYVRESARAITDSKGKTLYYDGTVENITKQKEIELELIKAKTRAEETEIQLLAILENSPTGFAINSIGSGKVRYVNRAFSEVYHIPIELCHNVQTFIDYVYGDQPEIGKKIITDTVSGDPERMRWEMIPVTDKVTKKVHYVSAANIILKDLDIMISSAWDVTSQVENEEKLIYALNKATESDRLKSAFLANMSHEIRTPMNGILGFASLLKEPQLTGEDQKKYIDIIEKSGERMLNTINDIIDISKIEAGQMEISISELNVVELFENISSFFKPEADKSGIVLSTSNKLKAEEATINSDKEKLNGILTNLIKNAIKFCDKGSIEFGCIRKDNYIEFHVKDTGKGIPQDKLDVVFDRFVQADIDDKEAKQGSGLGLSIAKSYVELMGGKIWVESKKDIGSTFFFTIPFMQEANSQEDKKNIQKDNIEDEIENLNILIAEDDHVSELLSKLMIEKISDKILIAKTGVETIELCKNNSDIDLILMDIKMPVLDGYEATRKIREFNKEVIIIATTAFALSGDREKALEAGCNDYLTKPLSQKELDEVLKIYFKV